MTGFDFLARLLRLSGLGRADAVARALRSLEFVELVKDKDRLIRGYSRGMRQRLKFAQAIAHDPDVLILDEPLSGLDPLSKRKVIRLIRDYRDAGKTILVSSHVLPEIESLTRTIVLLHQGKILARGDIHTIRDLIDKHPHVISIRCRDPRALGARLLGEPSVLDLRFAGTDAVILETNDRDRIFGLVPVLVTELGLEVDEIDSPDDNLQAVFDYLVGK
jgi:ABC-2 type transport system ATP-binding protein